MCKVITGNHVARLVKGEVYIDKGDEGGWYVSAWDGREPWVLGDVHGSLDEAKLAARVAILERGES